MFQSDELKQYLETSNTVQVNSLVFAEWNLNQPENIARIGNYRYRPGSTDAQYSTVPISYDINDAGNYYTGATDADIAIDGGYDDQGNPVTFVKKKEKLSLLYSLEDCFNPFRPRSGINKPIYLALSGASATSGQYITNPSPYDANSQSVTNQSYIANRPRYYMSSKDDQFKYWSSYRTKANPIIPGDATLLANEEFGLSRTKQNGRSYIYDACPFIVYKENIPSNRIIVKMQTNVGDINLGNMRVYGQSNTIPDPFYGYSNQTTPVRWKIQVLKNETSWVDAIVFDENSLRSDGTNIIRSDGYVELSYGLDIPDQYSEIFTYAGKIASIDDRPTVAPEGYAYLLQGNSDDKGTFYIYANSIWNAFEPKYNWQLSDDGITKNSKFVSDVTDPDYFWEQGRKVYREIDLIKGMRIVVETMNKENCTFDLIELSPRLAVNITDRTQDFSVTKTLSDLGNGNIPVGSLLAGTGNINLNNNDFAFSDTNYFDETTSTGSLIAKYLLTNIKFLFYEIIKNVNGYDYYVPIKTLYSEGFPQASGNFDQVSITLRDAFFIFESSPAPSIFLSDISLSNIVTVLLDYIGFSNYTFKRIAGQPDVIIPYFFVAPNQNVAEVLNQLAMATQTAMFFDEYNNFVTMCKEYLMPESGTRATDAEILGNTYVLDEKGNHYLLQGYVYSSSALPIEDVVGAYICRGILSGSSYVDQIYVKSNGIWTNVGNVVQTKLPNIIQISSANKSVNNNGQINYTKRYIQRNYGTTRQALYNDEYKSWTYVPTLLWEVSADKTTKAQNENATDQSGFSLAAMALNSDLTSEVPYVKNNAIFNNIIDVGENVYNHARYNGYLYSNGEIIKYDAIEYSITVAVWYPKNDDGSLDLTKPIIVPQGRLAPANVSDDDAYTWRESHGQGSSTVWINSADEYQNYLLQLPFNGKMYPTGNIRIWTEPEYITTNGITTMKQGNITKHGRAQFGTTITSHKAGLDEYWKNNEYVSGYRQEADYIFTTNDTVTYPLALSQSASTLAGVSASSLAKAKLSSRNGIIKNTLSQKYWTEKEINEFSTARTGTVQSSALVFTGPSFENTEKPRDFVSYVYKSLNNSYTHIGTRMRIIGKVESNQSNVQTPIGSTPYITINPTNSTQTVSISGGSGGMGVMVNSSNNMGYFFEIVALTTDNVSQYYDPNKKHVVSYQIPYGNVAITSGSVVTVTTQSNHQFTVGDMVSVVGFSQGSASSGINGDWTVTAITPRTITYQTSASVSGLPTTGGQLEIYIDTGVNINNIIFYKVVSGPDGKAYPIKLWSGFSNILVDTGRFVGQYRTVAEENPTVYDLAVEYKDNTSTRTFYLYINDQQVGVAVDKDPLPKTNNMCLFVRGASKCMFENVYALATNYSENTLASAINNISEIFGETEINSSQALRKYAVSGFVQAAYLGGISSSDATKFSMYYDEFGTIMREAVHFNIKYDRAFPALYARLAPTLNNVKTYATSGFYAGAYGADFLVFNCTDSNINLDASSGNYLRINGITFTQNTTKTLTVDDYFNKVASFSDPQIDAGNLIYNPQYEKKVYDEIKMSRIRHGNQEFTIESPFIQSDSAAEDILSWIIKKTMNPRKNIGMTTFGTQMLQLGDIVNIYYKNPDGIDVITPESKQYVVYNIEYTKSSGETSITTYLAEA